MFNSVLGLGTTINTGDCIKTVGANCREKLPKNLSIWLGLCTFFDIFVFEVSYNIKKSAASFEIKCDNNLS